MSLVNIKIPVYITVNLNKKYKKMEVIQKKCPELPIIRTKLQYGSSKER